MAVTKDKRAAGLATRRAPVSRIAEPVDPSPKSAPLTSAVIAEPAPQAAPKPSAFPAAETQQAEVIERVSFKLTADGKLDTESLRASTSEKAKGALGKSLKDEQFRKWAGIEKEKVEPVQIMRPADFGALLNCTSMIEAQLFARKFGLEAKEVMPIVQWDANDHALLDDRGAAICNKYIPSQYLNFADLLIFGSLLFTCMNVKMKAVEKYAHAKLERLGKLPSHDEARAAKPNGSAAVAVAPEPEAQPGRESLG